MKAKKKGGPVKMIPKAKTDGNVFKMYTPHTKSTNTFKKKG